MDISSECRMTHYRDDGHREDSPHVNNGSLTDFETHPNPIFYKGQIRVGSVPNQGYGKLQIRVRVSSKLENSSIFHFYHFSSKKTFVYIYLNSINKNDLMMKRASKRFICK